MSFFSKSGFDQFREIEFMVYSEKYLLALDMVKDIEESDIEILIQKKILLNVIYQALGKKKETIDVILEANKLAEEYSDERLILKSKTHLASTLWRFGDIDGAYNLLQQILHRFEESDAYDFIFYKARCNMIIGNIYWSKGIYYQAAHYTSIALNLWIKINERKFIGYCYNNIGYIHLFNGKLEEAIEYYLKGYEYICDGGGSVYFAQNLLNIVYAYLQFNNREEAGRFLELLKNTRDENRNDRTVNEFYNLGRAFYHKYSNRMNDRVKSEQILQKLNENKILEYQYQRLILIHLIEYYIFELAIFNDERIIQDINRYLTELDKLDTPAGLEFFEVEKILLKSKIMEIEGRYKEAEDLTIKGIEICDQYQFYTVKSKFEEVKEKIASRKILAINKEINMMAVDEMQLLIGDIIQYKLKSDKKKIFIPVFFQIIAEGGISLYAKELTNNININEGLISNFLSAINSFVIEILEKPGQMELIKMEEYNISLKIEDGILFTFMYKGDAIEVNILIDRIVRQIISHDNYIKLKSYVVNKNTAKFVDEILIRELEKL